MAKDDQIISKYVRGLASAFDDIIIDRLKDVGEQFVADARVMGSYTDQTSNLRGSIGYSIFKDGAAIFGAFNELTLEGKETGQRLISTIKEKYSKGIALICVAGMNYAVYVEAKGRDVITGAAQLAETNFKNTMQTVINSVAKKIKQDLK